MIHKTSCEALFIRFQRIGCVYSFYTQKIIYPSWKLNLEINLDPNILK